MTRTIVFLTDYGLQDEFVGVCHGVIARVAPDARVVDLVHNVPPGDVLRGALRLAESTSYMPDGAVYLAVVDPGVGSPRRGVAVEAVSGDLLVGPDNGLLSLAWEAMGGAVHAVEITEESLMLSPVSRTFHGRDVFSPVAAHLAAGAELAALGSAIDILHLAVVVPPEPVVDDGLIESEVIGVDRFGNVQLNVTRDHFQSGGFGPMLSVRGHRIQVIRVYADAPGQQLAALWDSHGWLSLIVTGESAAAALDLQPGDRVTLAKP